MEVGGQFHVLAALSPVEISMQSLIRSTEMSLRGAFSIDRNSGTSMYMLNKPTLKVIDLPYLYSTVFTD
jgi:hypothetical protein